MDKHIFGCRGGRELQLHNLAWAAHGFDGLMFFFQLA